MDLTILKWKLEDKYFWSYLHLKFHIFVVNTNLQGSHKYSKVTYFLQYSTEMYLTLRNAILHTSLYHKNSSRPTDDSTWCYGGYTIVSPNIISSDYSECQWCISYTSLWHWKTVIKQSAPSGRVHDTPKRCGIYALVSSFLTVLSGILRSSRSFELTLSG